MKNNRNLKESRSPTKPGDSMGARVDSTTGSRLRGRRRQRVLLVDRVRVPLSFRTQGLSRHGVEWEKRYYRVEGTSDDTTLGVVVEDPPPPPVKGEDLVISSSVDGRRKRGSDDRVSVLPPQVSPVKDGRDHRTGGTQRQWGRRASRRSTRMKPTFQNTNKRKGS